MIHSKMHWLAKLSVIAALSASHPVLAQTVCNGVDSPLFSGCNAEVWVLSPDSAGIRAIDLGAWVDDFKKSDGTAVVTINGGEQALVNDLARSSTPMTDGQPSISVASLAPASGSATSSVVPRLVMTPAAGSYDNTLAIGIGLLRSELAQGGIDLEISRDNTTIKTVKLCGGAQSPSADSCQAAQSIGAGAAADYLGVTIYLTEAGSADIKAVARRSGVLRGLADQRYTITINHPDGRRRDTDGDGVPDAVEALFGGDPTTADLLADRDGDGWSDFDEWLRTGDIAGVPQDSDKDGWSDFDETLRGTNPNDPVSSITADDLSSTTSEAYQRRLLRFKQKPVASTLYGVEYVGSPALKARQNNNGQPVGNNWRSAAAVAVGGETLWNSLTLLTAEELTSAGVGAADVAPELLQSNASSALSTNKLPNLRAAATQGLVIEAVLQASDGRTLVHKRAWAEQRPVNIVDFIDSNPQWDSVAEWRDLLIKWLEPRLVIELQEAIDWPSTRVVTVIEQAFSGEASVQPAASPIVLSAVADPKGREWLPEFYQRLLEFEAFSDSDAQLGAKVFGQLIGNTESALANGSLAAIGSYIDAATNLGRTAPQRKEFTKGQRSDLFLADLFASSIDVQQLGCFVPADLFADILADADELAAFRVDCPSSYTEDDLEALQLEDIARRHAIRISLLASQTRLLADNSLNQPTADSDGDLTENTTEIGLVPLRAATLPWLADSDGDGSNDSDDFCPLDPVDGCFGQPADLQVRADVKASVMEFEGGSSAVISVTLDRPAIQRVTLVLQPIEASLEDQDDASAGADFADRPIEVVIEVGEQFSFALIPIADDMDAENPEGFAVKIESLDGAVVAGGRNVVPVFVADNDASDPVPDPPVAVTSGGSFVDAGATVELSGSASDDPLGQGLSYQWQQIAGPSVDFGTGDTENITFVVPASANDTELQFRLTVTDANQRSDSAVEFVSVLARFNSAPRVVSQPTYQATRGVQLVVTAADLLANVVDDDGDPLSLIADFQLLAEGSLEVSETGLTFLPSSAMGSSTAMPLIADANIFGSHNAGQGRIIYRARGSATQGDRLFLYEAATNTVSLIVELAAGELLSEFRGGGDTLVVYFEVTSGQTFIWRAADGVRAVTGADNPGPLFASAIDNASGDLYFCDRASDEWERIDANTAVSTAAGPACRDTFSLFVAQRPAGVCMGEFDTIWCRQADNSLAALAQFPNGDLTSLYSVGDDLLAFVVVPTNSSWETHTVAPDGQTTLRIVAPESSSQFVRALRQADGSLLYPVLNEQFVRLRRWNGIAGSPAGPETVGSSQGPFADRRGAGSLARKDDKTFWHLHTADNEFSILEVTGTGGSAGIVSRYHYDGDNFNTPSFLQVTDNSVRAMRPFGEEGVCELFAVDQGNETSLLQDIGCFTVDLAGDELLYRRSSPDFSQTTAFRLDTGPGTQTVQVNVGVSDPDNATVQLPVTIEVNSP